MIYIIDLGRLLARLILTSGAKYKVPLLLKMFLFIYNETQGTLLGAPPFSSTFTLHGKVKSCASVLVALLATVQS